MRHSPLNPPSELLAALDAVAAGMVAVRAQMNSLQAAESLLLQAGDMLAQQMASIGTGRKPTDSALNMAYRTVQTEIGAAVHEPDRTIAVKMGRATDLVEKYPAVYRALARGEVSGAHANVIVDAGVIVDDTEARSKFEAAALEFAMAESVSRLRPVAKLFSEKYSGEQREVRYERASAMRRVFVVEREDGMADLTAYVRAPYAYGIKDRLDQMARNALDERRREESRVRAPGFGGPIDPGDTFVAGSSADASGHEPSGGMEGLDPAVEIPVDNRTADQLRADLLTDMLLTSDFRRLRTSGEPASGVSARVQVVVPVRRIARGTGRHSGAAKHGGAAKKRDFARSRGTDLGRRSQSKLSSSSESPLPRSTHPVDEIFRGLLDDIGRGFGSDRAPGASEISAQEINAQAATAVDPNEVAMLEGYGPIGDQDAVDLAGTADCWEKVTVDADTGTVISVDTYRPSVALRRFLGARDLHCRFPGCRAPLAWCDIDHTIDAALGGPTSSDNLGHLCRRHHTLKHASPWTVMQDQSGGFTWVSPAGRTYTDTPESNVRFREVTGGERVFSLSSSRSTAAFEGGGLQPFLPDSNDEGTAPSEPRDPMGTADTPSAGSPVGSTGSTDSASSDPRGCGSDDPRHMPF